jgi:hypothetical protein
LEWKVITLQPSWVWLDWAQRVRVRYSEWNNMNWSNWWSS